MTVEGLVEDGHIYSFNSIFPGPQLDTRGDAVNAAEPPHCAISAVSSRKVSTGALRRKYQAPSSQPAHPRSPHLSVTQLHAYLDTSSLY